MPQMAPLNWLTLFIMFMLIFIMFNKTNYFTFIYNTKSGKIKTLKLTYNWKW